LEGSGATVDGNIVTITSAGTYGISGTLDEGQIVVYTQDNAVVKLILNGADITCSTGAPVYIINADKTVVTLAEGTENYITDGDSYIFEDAASDEPNAVVFSKDDLTINGGGRLTVKANYNNGIASKDDLKITGGSITVNAVNDGIKGRDCIGIKDGIITVNAGGDGMQSNNDEDPEKGFVSIEGGTIDITAGADGIQAETGILIIGGDITMATGGGSSISTADSAKGLKTGVSMTIEGGTIDIDSADDSVHSNGSIVINGGLLALASGDDAIHADSTIEINGGDINIARCYEGIESANISINDGEIHLVSSDDGINAVSDDGGIPVMGPPGPGQDGGNDHLYINGGYIVVDALGDGFDVNGSVYMTSGSLIINGPVRNDNGALDYTGVFQMTGGFLVVVGSAGMAQTPSQSSTQSSMGLRYSSPQAAGTMIHIETEDGLEVLTFVPTKAYQSVVLCSSQLKKGATYVVYSGGSSTGAVTDGLYTGGTYTPGTELGSFTL
jgi:energy-converting hydrogenase Eha subunit E